MESIYGAGFWNVYHGHNGFAVISSYARPVFLAPMSLRYSNPSGRFTLHPCRLLERHHR